MNAEKDNQFDNNLRKALHKHTEYVPTDFTDRVLNKIQLQAEKKILARVILLERLSLAGCILLAVSAIAAAVFFTVIYGSLTQQFNIIIYQFTQELANLQSNWQFYFVFLAALGFAGYNLVELLAGKN